MASGSTDMDILRLAHEHNASLSACTSLHAKIYIADNKALVGSANATASGLGTSPIPNLEFLTEIEATNPDVMKVIEKLKKTAVPAKEFPQEILDSYAKDIAPIAIDHVWLPASMPEQVTDLLRNSIHNKEAAVDCDILGLLPGMTDRQIRSQINPQKVFQDLAVVSKRKVEGMLPKDVENFLITSFSVDPEEAASVATLVIEWIRSYSRKMFIVKAYDGGPLVTYMQRMDWEDED